MNAGAVVDEQILYLQHILDTVPFSAGARPSRFFLEIYKLTYADITSLGITEKSWAAYNQVSANKLLKLSISFGNLLKTFHLERDHYNTKNSNQSKALYLTKQSKDPFKESYTSETTSPVAPYYVTFTKNFYLILKNFDIGPAAGSMATTSSQNYSHTSSKSNLRNSQGSRIGEYEPSTQVNGPITNSPIKLNSRQLLIEKLEINIKLDALFTLKINLKLLQKLFAILKLSIASNGAIEAPVVDFETKPRSESSSIFSSVSGTSNGADSVTTLDDYTRLIFEVARRVSGGILDPFTDLLKAEIVSSQVLKGFQDLTNSM